MTVNGHAKTVQRFPDALCALCGPPASPGSDHVVVEFNPRWSPQDTVYRVWHRRCYDVLLDQVEES
jgi:hypothetical protein